MKKIFLYFLLLSLLLGGCSSAVQIDYAPREENRLVIYTSHKEDVYRPIVREFEERTGIWVELVSGGTSELLERIAQEKAAPRADIMFGGGVESLDSYRQYFRSVRCSEYEAIAANLRDAEDAWTPFSALPVVLIYNTKLVDPAALRGWEDLQRPEFSGKIAFADPTKSGSSFTALVTGLHACGEETMRSVARNMKGLQLGSSGEVLSAVANGSCLVGITLEETALQRIAAGDNLSMVYPAEGTSCVPDGTAVILGAHHEENAIRFLEFTVSKEVQQLLGSRFFRRAVRPDVPALSSLPPTDKLVLVDYDAQWAAGHRDSILQKWDAAIQEVQ